MAWQSTNLQERSLNKIGQYRIRRLALQLQQFTVRDLESAAGVTPQIVHAFIHQELDASNEDLVKRDQLPTSGRPGRPPLRYALTQTGMEVLAKRNLALARELNELISQHDEGEVEAVTSAIPRTHKTAAEPRDPTVITQEQATVGKSLVVKGEVTGSESLYIEGRVEGTINLPGNRVTVGPAGQVNANINAGEVVVLGKVKGNLTAHDRVYIRKGASLDGDVVCQSFIIEDGAYFKGSIDIRNVSSKDAASFGLESVGNESSAGAKYLGPPPYERLRS